LVKLKKENGVENRCIVKEVKIAEGHDNRCGESIGLAAGFRYSTFFVGDKDYHLLGVQTSS
jgi:hypothetical protein